jgi:hypothetical protein
MKNKISFAVLLVTFISSCSKVTKSEVVNYWNVESYEMVQTENIPGGTNTAIMNIVGSKYNYIEDFFDKADTIEDGKVQYFLFTIKKDGTWVIEKDLIYTKSFALSTRRWVERESGTWSFLKKTKGDSFKKNERIIFNTLKKTYTKGYAGVGFGPDNTNLTYLTGENSTIYTITEATNKKLKLELHKSNSSNSNTLLENGETYTTTNSTKISLIPALPN